ncbi:hypothetical protein DV096_02595 [Bradymonadaceae bacterium TMQ3]|uniref:Uncharacterized protein n=1 Tax=Lujinxingia sediminis TaxID=2480984 RepID=A0ABY0CX62_9DELT|nr:hypothetical protein [Lujinxingia sediminis]RDV39479.1 hypothetical protein DV096_02595 [Bradymonadaceae bacterium TMQ3]RVU48476.1 hypothetical protein EA187_03305 [Lujinxingia sediminis]TXC77778.1 hypothetical protein FRC91_03320 [Bradymonadales bacterium TMQ1]
MKRRVSREQLILMLDELDRGELDPGEVERLINTLELSMSDADALTLIEDDELSVGEVADQLLGYDPREG